MFQLLNENFQIGGNMNIHELRNKYRTGIVHLYAPANRKEVEALVELGFKVILVPHPRLKRMEMVAAELKSDIIKLKAMIADLKKAG